MKVVLHLFLVCLCATCLGQYQFSGTFPKKYVGQTAFLSLVEDYRKADRPYRSQIIQKTEIDATGTFVFNGNRLSPSNRIYRIHIDDCPHTLGGKAHYLSVCTHSKQVVFIANNTSTVLFPILSNDQPLCQIGGNDTNAGALLEIDQLKEAMIIDFMESHSTTDEQLKFGQWFDELQQYALNTGEPLVELYVYDFLSDKKNETHAYYIQDLAHNPYYQKLGKRLANNYDKAPFVAQYTLELKADSAVIGTGPKAGIDLLWVVGVAVVLITLFFGTLKYYKNRKSNNLNIPTELTPQEQRVYKAIQNNKTNKEIALELFISTSTVKTHINNIYKKLDVTSRKDIVKNPPRV